MPFPGEFTKVDEDAKFFYDNNIEGVQILKDLDLIKDIHQRLGAYAQGPTDFFPASWPASLCTDNLDRLSSEPYVVRAKPRGIRYLLYIDDEGEVYLENMTQQVFYVEEEHAVQFPSISVDTVKDSVLDGIVTELLQDEEEEKRFVFVIQDATRINAVDLTNRGVEERISCVKEEIIKPRLRAIRNRFIQTECEVFGIDVAEYRKASEAEELISEEFKSQFKYPYRSIVFHPEKEKYLTGTSENVLQWDATTEAECSFLMKIKKNEEGNEIGILYAGLPQRVLGIYGMVDWTDELKKWNNCIIEMSYVDHHWNFVRVRSDRKHPNSKKIVDAKLHALEKAVSTEALLAFVEKLE